MSLEDCQKEYRTLVKKIKEIERDDQGSLCKKELQFQVELKEMAGNRAGAEGIKNIRKAEETKEMLRQLKWAKPQKLQSGYQLMETTALIIARNAILGRH
jgi:hypothetical protein